MRIGVISDIHGNGVALEAVLADVADHPVDRWICLGDALQGGVQPVEVVERLRELDCPVVLGNADAFLLGEGSGEEVSGGQWRERDWTVEALGPHGLEFIGTFVPTYELELTEGNKLLCFHGSPDSYDTVLLPETPSHELRRELGGRDARTMCGGHTHQQWSVSIDGWTYFNSGSVGLAYNRHLPADRVYIDPTAEFAILSVEGDEARIEFCRVPYDVEDVDRAARGSGHPYADRQAALYRPPTV